MSRTRKFGGGTVVPKANIGAIRGGDPSKILQTSEVCSIYIDVRLPPEEDPLRIKEEIESIPKQLGLRATVELFLFRPGYEAKNATRLVESVERAHMRFFKEKPGMAEAPISSMWRDLIVFNEVGIPAITYGPGAGVGGRKFSVTVDDLERCSKLFALTALYLCDQKKSK